MPLETIKAHLELFIRHAPVALAMLDRRMCYVAWSDRWARDYGLTGDLKGRSHYEVVPDQPAHWRDIHQRALAGEIIRMEAERFDRADGSTLWLRWQIDPIVTDVGDVVGISLFTEDITALKSAKLALGASEENLKSAATAAGFGIFEHDFEAARSTVSDGYRRLLDLAKGQEPKDLEGWIALLRPRDVAVFMASRQAALDPAGSGYMTAELLPRVGGRVRQMRLSAQVLFSGEGPSRRPTRLVGILIDEAETKRQHETLARAQRLETVGRLAGVVAHDFNNLLTVILSNLELAELRIEDEQALTFLKRASEAAEMGAGFNKRLLALAGGRRPAPVPVSVNARLSDTWQILERAMGDNMRVRFAPGTDLPAIKVDPGELDGAILNLVVNARDAMPSGGDVVISTARVTIDEAEASRHAGARAGDYVRIAVRDTGPGMPPEVALHAFEPFYSTKPPGMGSGLGLTGVSMTAERASGFVTIDSPPGQGATVAIWLPPTDEVPAQSSNDAKMPFGDGEEVLVVEDDPLVREALLQRLEVLGYSVCEAPDAATALHLIETGEPIRLVFSDVVMPGELTGYELIDAVRARHPGIAVLLTSGHISAQRPHRAHTLTNVELLAKPYQLGTLARAVRRALSRTPPTSPRTSPT